nr:aromatic ring-hydroxylating dioxygenase subunit alpha [Pseudenhygromyxa sp. WMMC2535]
MWWPLAFSSQLDDRPLAVVLAGERLALFRDGAGTPRAVFDRCPHRGVELSQGRVAADGCLECPYHGWRFDGGGRCVDVPFNPGAKLDRLGVGAMATVERGGLIWVFADEQASAEDPRVLAGPDLPDSLEQPGLRRREAEFVWRCHWTRLAENMLDVAHLPYVHRATIGKRLRDATGRSLAQHVEDRDFGFEIHWDETGERDLQDPAARSGAYLGWYRPCLSMLVLSGPQGIYRQHMMSVPGAAGETRLLLVSARRFVAGVDMPLWPAMNWYEDRIINEDRRIVESSDPAIAPPPADERSVPSDAATLRFRKWYWAHRRSLAEGVTS